MNLHLREDATADRREGERRREPSKNALRVQNAELVKALRNLIAWGELLGPTPDSGEWIAIANAKAALAKVTP